MEPCWFECLKIEIFYVKLQKFLKIFSLLFLKEDELQVNGGAFNYSPVLQRGRFTVCDSYWAVKNGESFQQWLTLMSLKQAP